MLIEGNGHATTYDEGKDNTERARGVGDGELATIFKLFDMIE